MRSARLTNAGFGGEFRYRGALDREQKIDFLRGLDVFSVPTVYVEPKGLFLLEAMACGVPVVQPRHGAFPEMLAKTSGGILVEPDDTQSLAEGSTNCGRTRRCAPSWDRTRSTASARITASAARPIACSRCTRGRCAERKRSREIVSIGAGRRAGAVRCVVVIFAGRRRSDHGAVGKRQEHAALYSRRARAADDRHRDAWRREPVRLVREGSRGVPQQGNRLRVPGPLPAAAMQCARERARAHARGAG